MYEGAVMSTRPPAIATMNCHPAKLSVEPDGETSPTSRRTTVHRHTLPRPLVGTLDGPSKTIVVEPIQIPAGKPLPPAVTPEREPERSAPPPEREPVPAG